MKKFVLILGALVSVLIANEVRAAVVMMQAYGVCVDDGTKQGKRCIGPYNTIKKCDEEWEYRRSKERMGDISGNCQNLFNPDEHACKEFESMEKCTDELQ